MDLGPGINPPLPAPSGAGSPCVEDTNGLPSEDVRSALGHHTGAVTSPEHLSVANQLDDSFSEESRGVHSQQTAEEDKLLLQRHEPIIREMSHFLTNLTLSERKHLGLTHPYTPELGRSATKVMSEAITRTEGMIGELMAAEYGKQHSFVQL